MAKANKHSVVLPDGTVGRRTSLNRVYTHAIAYGPTPIDYAIASTKRRVERLTEYVANPSAYDNDAYKANMKSQLDQATAALDQLLADQAAGATVGPDNWSTEHWCGSYELAQRQMRAQHIQFWLGKGREIRIVEVTDIVLKD